MGPGLVRAAEPGGCLRRRRCSSTTCSSCQGALRLLPPIGRSGLGIVGGLEFEPLGVRAMWQRAPILCLSNHPRPLKAGCMPCAAAVGCPHGVLPPSLICSWPKSGIIRVGLGHKSRGPVCVPSNDAHRPPPTHRHTQRAARGRAAGGSGGGRWQWGAEGGERGPPTVLPAAPAQVHHARRRGHAAPGTCVCVCGWVGGPTSVAALSQAPCVACVSCSWLGREGGWRGSSLSHLGRF